VEKERERAFSPEWSNFNFKVVLFELIVDDFRSFWKLIERDLREEMMLSLILHSSHENHRNKRSEMIVCCSCDLMLDER